MHAINASTMRHVNRTLLLDEIRRQPISRAELSEKVGLTRASVTQIVDELISEDLVLETALVGRSRLGRRSTQLALNAKAGYFFGVNLEREQCTIGVMNFLGEVLHERVELISGRTAVQVLDDIAKNIADIRAEMQMEESRIFGVGMCMPGPVDYRTGQILNPTNYVAWNQLPVGEMLRERTGLKIFLENTADARALEEKYFFGREEDFVLMGVGDSISLGVIVNGKLYRGSAALPMELGRCPISPDGSRVLADVVSVPALFRETGCSSWVELYANASRPEVAEKIRMLTKYLTVSIVNILYAYRMNRVVLVSNVQPMVDQDHYVQKVNEDIDRLTSIPAMKDIVISGKLGDPVRCAASAAYRTMFMLD